MADPVQVLVTIHPTLGLETDWVGAVSSGLYRVLGDIAYEVKQLDPPQPHGEAKAHREAAERALEDSDMMSRHDDGWWQHRAMQAVAHALLALGERP